MTLHHRPHNQAHFRSVTIAPAAATLIISLCMALALASCGPSADDRRLMLADRLMDTRPDSALCILDSIDPAALPEGKTRALYGLLMTMARDKNHLDPDDETIISYARDYFADHSDPLRHTVATYYHGRVRQHNGDNTGAQSLYFKAKDLAIDIGSPFWTGMACRGISDMYNLAHNGAEALIYAHKEEEYTRLSGRQPYINYAMNDLGIAYLANFQYDEAFSIGRNLLDSAAKYDDSLLRCYALRLKSHTLVDRHEWDKAENVLADLYATGWSTARDSLNMVFAMIGNRKFIEAGGLLESIDSVQEAPVYSLARYEYAAATGDTQLALGELQKAFDFTNEYYIRATTCNLNGVIEGYFEIERQLSIEREHNMRIYLCLTWIIAIVAISASVYIFYRIRKRQQTIIDNKIRLAEQLRETLDNLRKENSKASLVITNLMASRYSMLDEMGHILLENPDSRKARKKIADTVTSLIKDLSGPGPLISKMEHDVDELHDNLFSDFRNDFPDLKDADYRLFLFTILKFSNSTIFLLLGENKITNLYDRKRRLKDRIRKHESRNRERYLEHLN